jgi:hypothetical protein
MLFKAQSRLRSNRIKTKIKHVAASVSTVFIISLMFIGSARYFVSTVTATAPGDEPKVVEKIVIKEQPRENIDTWIGDSVDQFLPTHKSEARMIMHCLAHRESGHGSSNSQGDGGLAGGGFQFHEATWVGMRKMMIKQGAATEIGSRFNLKQATYTTAWALSNGDALEWGPILRDSHGSNFASCQTPSWYK